MLAELHSHTYYSKGTKVLHEGLNSTEQMARHAKKLGLGAIAITDHDSIEGNKHAKSISKKLGIIVIPYTILGVDSDKNRLTMIQA